MNTTQIIEEYPAPKIQKRIFTCKKCKSHEVLVAGLYRIIEEYKKVLPCECGKAKDGRAAVQSFRIEKTYEDHGYLDNEHNWDFIDKNKIIERREIEQDIQLNCGMCFLIHELDSRKWKTELLRIELMDKSVEFYVYCAGCGRELEFGWSHAERSGRILPVECIDFDPQKAWPEPRFRENWVQKGWLHSDQMFLIFRAENRFRTVLKKIGLKKTPQF